MGFLKALHQENSLRYELSLTMQEVFYWSRQLNERKHFQCIISGPGAVWISPSPHPGTPHTTFVCHTQRARKTMIFLQKCCGFLGEPGWAEEESELAVPPIHLREGQGILQGFIHQHFIQLLLILWEFLSWVLLKQQIIQIQAGGWRKQRPWKRQSGSTAPPCRGTSRSGQFSLEGRKFLPNAGIFGITWQLQVRAEPAHHWCSYQKTNSNQDMVQSFVVKKSLCCCSATAALQIRSALSKFPCFIIFPIFFFGPGEGRTCFQEATGEAWPGC